VGYGAMGDDTSGSYNAGIGYAVLVTNTTGSNNAALGSAADVSVGNLSNATAIGSGAVVNASNKIRLGNTSVSVIEGNVAYTFTSDRTKKENFQPVDGAEVLKKVRDLNLTSWNYIGQDPKTTRHFGPMAQDYYAAFGRDAIGSSGNDTTINSGDMAGVTLVAVKKLAEENAALKEDLTNLKGRLAKLEQLIPTAGKGSDTAAVSGK
jgi:endosialidase-like protein